MDALWVGTRAVGITLMLGGLILCALTCTIANHMGHPPSMAAAAGAAAATIGLVLSIAGRHGASWFDV